MSKYSRPLSRPRTKVYDTNYNIGESYYKSALDGIDRKYGRVPSGPMNDSFFSARPAPFVVEPPPVDMQPPRSALRNMEDEFFGDRRGGGGLLGEYDTLFDGRMRNGMQRERTPMRGGNRGFDDELENDLASSMKMLKSVKITKSVANDFDDESTMPGKRDSRLRQKLDFSDKVMDSVGLTGRVRAALEDDGSTMGRRRVLKMTSDAGESDDLTKWTALRPTLPRRQMLELDDDMAASGAASRAMKSRARLEDLESEMQALSEKSAAREKRVRDLKALVQENEANSLDNMHTAVRVQSSIESEKRTMNF